MDASSKIADINVPPKLELENVMNLAILVDEETIAKQRQ